MDMPGGNDDGVKELRRTIHSTIGKVTHAFEHGFAFNVAIAALMELSNTLQAFEVKGAAGSAARLEGVEALVTMLAPFVPHFACECGERLGMPEMAVVTTWPQVDHSALETDVVTLVVQIQGKKRGEITVPVDTDQDTALATAQADATIAKWLDGMVIVKVILVQGRLLNLVVRPQ
jgi:leucyl-tRNA synthetase